jgi:hypothetical protein
VAGSNERNPAAHGEIPHINWQTSARSLPLHLRHPRSDAADSSGPNGTGHRWRTGNLRAKGKAVLAATGRRRPNAPIRTNFAPYPLASRSLDCGQALARLDGGFQPRCPPRMHTRRTAAIHPAPRLLAFSCPMLSGEPAYHDASEIKGNFPGQPGHDKAPWTIRQDHPGGKAPALGTHHET